MGGWVGYAWPSGMALRHPCGGTQNKITGRDGRALGLALGLGALLASLYARWPRALLAGVHTVRMGAPDGAGPQHPRGAGISTLPHPPPPPPPRPAPRALLAAGAAGRLVSLAPDARAPRDPAARGPCLRKPRAVGAAPAGTSIGACCGGGSCTTALRGCGGRREDLCFVPCARHGAAGGVCRPDGGDCSAQRCAVGVRGA